VTAPVATTSTHPRRWLRSTAAVVIGFVAVVVLSLGTDQVLHVLKVYPPWGEPMLDPGLCFLALAYRTVYAIIGSYIAAQLAPHNPMRHAMALGIVGLAVSTPVRSPRSRCTWAQPGTRSRWPSPLCPAPGSAEFCTAQGTPSHEQLISFRLQTSGCCRHEALSHAKYHAEQSSSRRSLCLFPKLTK
jgi:hypothetical protein